MTTDPRDPRVREVVFELLQAAPEAPPFPDVIAMNEDVVRKHRPARRLRVAAAMIVALAVVTAAIVVVARRAPSKRSPVVGPTTTGVTGASAPPDVAFVDRRGLVVRAAGSDRDTVVAPGAVSAPLWSPSGDWLAYRVGDTMWVVRKDGAYRRPIADLRPVDFFAHAYAWSPTVDALAVVGKNVLSVWWVAGTDLEDVLITPPVGGVEQSVEDVAWTRGGTSLVISMERRTVHGPGAPEASLWLATHVCEGTRPASCRVPEQLTPLPFTPGPSDYPIYVAGVSFDNRYVLIWPDEIGSTSIALDGLPLKAVPIDGGPVTTLGDTLVRDAWVPSSPIGSRVVIVSSNGRMVTDNREVQVCDAPSSCRPLAPGTDVQTLDPAWSPSGEQVAFVREPRASTSPPLENGNIDWTVKYRTRELWIANTDGSGPRALAAAGAGVADPQFSPDGRSIVFVRDARLWQLDLASDRVTARSGSMRVTGACAAGDCLPDEAVYETEARWLDHEAVYFEAAK